MTEGERAGYIVEILQVGNSLKVSAVDPVTGREVSIIAPVNASEADLHRAAVQKLEFVLGRDKGKRRREDGGKRPGTLV